MKYATMVARVLLGLLFVFSGANYFLHLTPMPTEGMPTDAQGYLAILGASGYMTAVKVCEILGGALLIVGKFVPLGVTILMPVIVNVLLFEVCLLGAPGIAAVLLLVNIFLVYAYRSHFAPFFKP